MPSSLARPAASARAIAQAQALACAGTNVMLDGFGDRDASRNCAAGLPPRPACRSPYSAADMSKPTEIAQMVAQAETDFGSVDILFNNAGLQFVAPVDEYPDAKWEQFIGINLSSNFYAIKAVPGMKRRRRSTALGSTSTSISRRLVRNMVAPTSVTCALAISSLADVGRRLGKKTYLIAVPGSPG